MVLKAYIYPLLILAAFAVQARPPSASSLESSSELNIKAAYLFNFAKFVEWPPTVFRSEGAPIVFCVLGDDPLTEILKTLERKTVVGRPLSVRHARAMTDMVDCHILYIGESQAKNMDNILRHVGDKPLLTVSSADDFALKGGMIGFVRVGNTIRFDVNFAVVRRSGLTISSRLLRLAMIVEPTNQADN